MDSIVTDDDVAVERLDLQRRARGVAGTLVVEKIVGAAAEMGRDLAFAQTLLASASTHARARWAWH